jgi:hypothetical protein
LLGLAISIALPAQQEKFAHLRDRRAGRRTFGKPGHEGGPA